MSLNNQPSHWDPVGELLPVATPEKNGLVSKNYGFYKQTDYNEDLNNAPNGYLRHVGSIETTNAPEGTVEVPFAGIVYTLNLTSAIKLQHAISPSGNIYERILWSTWRPWIKMT